MRVQNKYSSNVFVNCPFDRGYDLIFDAIVFTVCDCGFVPRCSKERANADEIRIEKIYKIVEECKYGIHDISRASAYPPNNLARFNMPFELGVFLGCKKFGSKSHNGKSCVIIDKEQYRYQQFLSDISGQDIGAHNDSPQIASKIVRNFLSDKTKRKSIPSAQKIWDRYTKFRENMPELADGRHWDINQLTFLEYFELIYSWLEFKE